MLIFISKLFKILIICKHETKNNFEVFAFFNFCTSQFIKTLKIVHLLIKILSFKLSYKKIDSRKTTVEKKN